MRAITLILALVLLLFACQLPSEAGGADGPPVDSRVAGALVAPGSNGYGWYEIQDGANGGAVSLVYGWPWGDVISFYRERQPAVPDHVARAHWERQRQRSGVVNYGLDAPRLQAESRSIRASDPETLRYAESLICDDCPNNGGRCKKHPEGPIQRVEHDLEAYAILAVAAVLFLGAVIVLIKGKT